jgi:hypothetical protein
MRENLLQVLLLTILSSMVRCFAPASGPSPIVFVHRSRRNNRRALLALHQSNKTETFDQSTVTEVDAAVEKLDKVTEMQQPRDEPKRAIAQSKKKYGRPKGIEENTQGNDSTSKWKQELHSTNQAIDNAILKTEGASSTRERQEAEKRYDLPWGNLQKWALRDHMAKYSVQVPVTRNGKETIRVFTLWRTFIDEVTELCGYPIPFLLERYAEMRASNDTTFDTSSDVLPYLDDFSFENNGGLSGRVSGIIGVADGTKIQTTPVGDLRSTIPKGFVRTDDGAVIYELGRPASDFTYDVNRDAKSKLSKAASSVMSRAPKDLVVSDVVPDAELVRLGALTATIIAGAAAFESLSHHLTVNVFWV